MPPSTAEVDQPKPLLDDSGPAQSQAVILSTAESQSASWFQRWRLALLALAVGTISLPLTFLQPAKISIDPTDYAARTKHVLSTTPLIDGHNDLPHLIRIELYGKMYDGTFNFNDKLLGHTDVQRMRRGQMGGQFWSVFVECEEPGVGIDDPSVSLRYQKSEDLLTPIS